MPAAPATAPPRPRPSGRRQLFFLALGVVLAAALGVGLFATQSPGAKGGPPRVGDPVPHFRLAGLAGSPPVAVPGDGGGNGRGAVLLFFASWCTPCQAEIPAVAAVVERQRANHDRLAGVPVLGIDGSDPTSSAESFVRRSAVTFPVGVDADYAVTQGQFGFNGLPEAVLVRPDGTIGGIHYGAIDRRTLLSWQRQAMNGG